MLALLLIQACANSSLGRPELIDSECPYEGRWTLSEVDCGAFASFEPFFERYETATLVVSSSQTGCAVQVGLEGVSCAATERWAITLDEDDDTTGELESSGILACEPEGCSFDGTTPCLPGAGAGTGEVTLSMADDVLVLSGGFGAAADDLDCPLGLVATFVAAP